MGGGAVAAAAWAAAPLLHASPAAAAGSELVGPDVSVTGLAGAIAGGRFVGATTGGAPVSGSFAIGDTVIDQTGGLWICTIAGSPGTWTFIGSGYELGYVQDAVLHASITSTSDMALTGFTKTVMIPATNRPIYIDVHIPMLGMSTTPGLVVLSIYEDGASIIGMGGGAVLTIPASAYASARFRVRRTPSAGAHTYAIYGRVSAGSVTIYNGWVPSDMTITQQ